MEKLIAAIETLLDWDNCKCNFIENLHYRNKERKISCRKNKFRVGIFT